MHVLITCDSTACYNIHCDAGPVEKITLVTGHLKDSQYAISLPASHSCAQGVLRALCPSLC